MGQESPDICPGLRAAIATVRVDKYSPEKVARSLCRLFRSVGQHFYRGCLDKWTSPNVIVILASRQNNVAASLGTYQQLAKSHIIIHPLGREIEFTDRKHEPSFDDGKIPSHPTDCHNPSGK